MAEEDLIFGKNRHFFGGIEPSNMKTFTVSAEENAVQINAELPEDTVVNGQTLCTVKGAVIRRKDTDYPKDEFDGELVANVTESVLFVDESASTNGTYFYAAFPYTSQGVYNRNAVNRAVVNEPASLTEFTANSVYVKSTDSARIELTVSIPDNVAGVIIRRSIAGYPKNETDGVSIADQKTSGKVTDSNVIIGRTYYYSAFPYNSAGVYNRSESDRVFVTARKYEYIYGYDLNESDPNPATRVTYPEDVDNASFAAAKMNFSSNVFEYGDWPSVPGKMFMPKPCMLTYSGKVDHYLDPNNYKLKENSSEASSVASTAFEGNAMMEWSKIYTKRWADSNGYHFRCSDQKIDGDYECWSNYDKNDREIDHFYTPIYFGSNVSSRLRSISGASNSVNTTAPTELTLAKANGGDMWCIETVVDRMLICDLLTMMAKTTNHQTAYGSGRSASGNQSAIGQGTMDTNGLFWGSTNQTSGVKVFGMENFWGNLWRRTAGLINANGTQKVKITRGVKDGSTVSDYNIDGSGYLTLADATPSGTSGGYISKTKTLPYGRFAVTASGSGTTNECDGLWFNNGQSNFAIFGGSWNYALLCGGFCVSLGDAPSGAYSDYGAALSCKPLAGT